MIIESSKRERGIMAFLLSLVIVSAGCNGLSRKTETNFRLNSPISGKVEASGNAKEPAKVETAQTETKIPLPVHSQVSIVAATPTEPAKTIVTLAAASEATTVSRVEKITAPISHSPPSATDIAKADGVRWFYIAGAIFAVAALALVYFQHYKAAGCAAVGAFAVPTLGNVLSHQSALIAAVALGVASFVLFVAWYLAKSKLTSA